MYTSIALVNQKGGCGKTTSAIHLASALALREHRVLLIDMDPQGHAALGLGIEPSDTTAALSDVLARSALNGAGPGLEQCVVAARPGLDLIPANLGLAGLEQRLATAPGREERLAEHLANIADAWDVVVIDCPPNLGLLTVNALVAASQALVPVEPSVFAVHGLERVLSTLRVVEEYTGHHVSPRILPTMVSPRDEAGLALFAQLSLKYPGLVLDTRVRRSALAARAAAAGHTIRELSPSAPSWRDYVDVADALVREWGELGGPSRPRFAGLRVVPGGVEFTHPEFEPGAVQLAGEFNRWAPDGGVVLRDRGVRGWSKFLALAPGRYEYKFVIHGEWMPDPVNPRRALANFGITNSVIDVPRAPEDLRRPGAARPRP